MTRPRSRTATRSRTVSASMTLWVTSSTVAPCSARRRSTADQHGPPATGSMPVVAHDEQRPPPDQSGCEAGQPPQLSAGQLLRGGSDRGEAQLVKHGVPLGPRLAQFEPARSRPVVSAASDTVSSSRAVDSCPR